jgi:HAD superfamily hydrolase (TIGR01459 family)
MIDKLINIYETFILDIWGVLHNGKQLLGGVEEFIAKLEAKDKQYYLLSNAPRSVGFAHDRLVRLGLDIPKNRILTSGAFFLETLTNPKLMPSVDLFGKAAVIGIEKNDELLKNADIEIVSSFKEANYLIMLAFADDEEEMYYYYESLKNALRCGLPMICINPDKIVFEGNKKRYCQGHFASIYAEMGGKVHYFGKPYPEIYQYLFNLHSLSKDKAIMIGDSINTDIEGASTFSIDSALLLTGIHQEEADIDNLLKLSIAKPTYVLNNLIGSYE